MDHDSGVAERKGLLNHRYLLGSWYNKPMDHNRGIAAKRKTDKGRLYEICFSHVRMQSQSV